MSEAALAAARTSFDRVLAWEVGPAPADLWELQKALLVVGDVRIVLDPLFDGQPRDVA